MNDALAAAPARHRNLRVVDWAQVADGHPEWIARIHFMPAGQTAYAKTIAAALAQLRRGSA